MVTAQYLWIEFCSVLTKLVATDVVSAINEDITERHQRMWSIIPEPVKFKQDLLFSLTYTT